MRILCITHADFESPGVILDWAESRKHSLSIVRPYQGEEISKIEPSDMLIVMGGPQSPRNLSEAPYLRDEIAHIQKCLEQCKPVLGFCLGAQLMGEALGVRTEPSPEKEVGVFPIELTDAGRRDLLFDGCDSSFNVIHWHNDMPGLTQDAVVLAKSKGCPRQIVRYGQLAYGFQCHLEITREGIQTLAQACPDDLRPSRWTQSKVELLQNDYSIVNALMFTLLDRFARLMS